MQIQSTQEALFVACQMERNAIQLYDRALLLLPQLGRMDPALQEAIARTRDDEKRHLAMFQELFVGVDGSTEEMLALSAVSNGVLFKGGLMAAVREGLLDDEDSMLRYAIQEEEKAVTIYRSFAEQCGDEDTRFLLKTIAEEEQRHWDTLQAQLTSQA